MEKLETINQRLLDYFGRFDDGSSPRWRVSWSKDHTERRFGTYDKFSEHGVWTGQVTEWREVPKYGYMTPQWILERVVGIPEGTDLDAKMSYECMWAFGFDPFGNPLPPKWEAIEIVIATIAANMAKPKGGVQYETPFEEMQTPEAIQARIDAMEEMLFEKSRIGDSLNLGFGVSYTGAYKKVESDNGDSGTKAAVNLPSASESAG